MMAISTVKDIFYFLGSMAGFVSLFKPILESRFNIDKAKIDALLLNIQEKSCISSFNQIGNSSTIECDFIDGLEYVAYQIRNKTTEVHFRGPLASLISDELGELYLLNDSLRGLIQVPFWKPVKFEKGFEYHLDKSWFRENRRDYTQNMDCSMQVLEQIRRRIRRLMHLSDMHFLESFLPYRIILIRLQRLELSLES